MGNVSKPFSGTDKSKISKTPIIWKTKITELEKCVPSKQVNKYFISINKTVSSLFF